MIQQEKGQLLFIKTVYQTDNEKRLSNNFFLTASPLSNKLWQIIYDRLSVREEIGFTLLFLLKRKKQEASSNYIFEFGLLFFYLYMFLLHSSKKLYYTLMRI